MDKIKYELDPYNRLTAADSSLRGMRKVLEGRFRGSGNNTLTYHVKSPLPAGIKSPHQLKLKGEWSLTGGSQLSFALDKSARETFGDQITLQGEIISAQKNSLLFALTGRTKENTPSVYLLELTGSWQADERNRLTFKVNRESARFDSLVFEGAWEVDKNYQLIYRYEKEELARKKRRIHTLTFKGYWDIRDKLRLFYVLDGVSGSGFDFKAAAGIFKENYIKYELGIGISGRKKPVKRVVTFFGRWRLKKNTGLIFEVEQEKGKTQAIVFGAEVKLSESGEVTFSLRNTLNKEMGVRIGLSRGIFGKDGQVFLRLLKSRQESAILAGAGFRW